MIRIQDVDRLETELEKIKECLAGLEGATDNLQLWKENIQSRLNALESRSKLANCVDVEEFYKDDAPATPQPVRIRPEWIDGGDNVWKWMPKANKARKIRVCDLIPGDLWQPVLSPDEPAPEAPCEVEK